MFTESLRSHLLSSDITSKGSGVLATLNFAGLSPILVWYDVQKLGSALSRLGLHPVLHSQKYISNCKLLRLARISASKKKSGSDSGARISLKCLQERDEILMVDPFSFSCVLCFSFK